MKSFIGKRIIVFWTTAAFNEGADWPSYRVIDANLDCAWCHGIDSPDGTSHDGSKCSIKISETLNIIEWKENA
jgi:hypothetical protein